MSKSPVSCRGARRLRRRGVHAPAAGVRCRPWPTMLAEAKAAGQVLRYVGPGRCRRQGDRGAYAPRREACLCEHRAHRQRGAFRDPALLRQSAHRAGPGRRTRGHGRGRVLGSVAPVGISRRAICSAAASLCSTTSPLSRLPPSPTSASASTSWGTRCEAVGDRVRLRRIDEPVVRIRAVTGVAGELPVDPGAKYRRPGAAGDAGGAQARASASRWRSRRVSRSHPAWGAPPHPRSPRWLRPTR